MGRCHTTFQGTIVVFHFLENSHHFQTQNKTFQGTHCWISHEPWLLLFVRCVVEILQCFQHNWSVDRRILCPLQPQLGQHHVQQYCPYHQSLHLVLEFEFPSYYNDSCQQESHMEWRSFFLPWQLSQKNMPQYETWVEQQKYPERRYLQPIYQSFHHGWLSKLGDQWHSVEDSNCVDH